jgi:L-ribulose-5-phosphate 4-epimerase
MLDQLKREVCDANCELAALGLAALTWGNVSGLSPDRALMVIKPSGVPYAELTPEKMSVVNVQSGDAVEGLKPSSDAPTHCYLYQHFASIGGITHTHSPKATAFAQARREIPCLGTTHADHFYGSVPVTRALTEQEVLEAYELNTGVVKRPLRWRLTRWRLSAISRLSTRFCSRSTTRASMERTPTTVSDNRLRALNLP